MTLSFTEATRSTIEEAFHATRDGLRIYSCVHPVSSPRGVVLLTHGLGEHSGRYGHVIHSFQEATLAVVRFDLPGHGRSDGNRGHISSYAATLDAVSMMFQQTKERFPEVPVVLFGHSLGGNIVANWLLRNQKESAQVTAAVLSSPWFKLTIPPSALKVAIIQTLSKYFPKLLVPAQFRPRRLTRNADAIDCYENDPLIHRHASVRLISDAYSAGRWALEHAGECLTPILGTHGTADTVTSPEGTQLFCERAPHADLLLFENLVHEPHNEPEWKSVVEQIRSWIVEKIDSASKITPRKAAAMED